MNTSHPPGQAGRFVGSLAIMLGAGIMLDTSYQSVGMGVILAGLVLLGLGWLAHWRAPT